MAASADISKELLELTKLVDFCREKEGSFLVQQSKKVVQLFSQLCLGEYVDKRDVSRLQYEELPFSLSSQENWEYCPPLDPNIRGCWKDKDRSLELFYDERGNLKAQIKEKEKDPINIPSGNIYLSWEKPYAELTPYLHLDNLYLIDLSDTKTIICQESPTPLFKQEEMESVIQSLHSYLKMQHERHRVSLDSAVRLQECSNAVCRIITGDNQKGTGFVIGNRLLITNHHVLSTQEQCRGARAEFFYDNPGMQNVVNADFDPDTFFVSSPSPDKDGKIPLSEDKLDFTIVALKSDPRLNGVFACPISLDKNVLREEERVFLIHHPLGSEKKTSICSSKDPTHRIVKVEKLYLVHTADSDPGSSGAPLLNAAFKLMALNRQLFGHVEKAAVKIDAVCTYLKSHEDYWGKILKEFAPLQQKSAQDSQLIGCCPLPPKDFTGRKEDLEKLHRACTDNNRVAISGLGGVGKTALALQYAKKHKQDYYFVNFIPSSTPQLVTQGLIELADDLKIPEDKDVSNRLTMLKRKLDRLGKKYLLIFDGLDQVETFQELESYLPAQGNCILLTSRMPEQARSLECEIISLDVLVEEDAIDYLLKTTDSQEREAAALLSQELGYLPLALNQAVGYIRSQKTKIKEYYKLFKEYELELFKPRPLTLANREKTILKTWEISMQAIVEKNRASLASDVLNMFAFLAQAPIPRNLIDIWSKKHAPTRNQLDLRDALTELCNYSMIDGEKDLYRVHSLVQTVTRCKLSTDEKQLFIEELAATFQAISFTAEDSDEDKTEEIDDQNYKHRPLIKLLIPHAVNLIQQADEENLFKLPNSINLLDRVLSTSPDDPLDLTSVLLQLTKNSFLSVLLAELARRTGGWLTNVLGSNPESHKTALKFFNKALEIICRFSGEDSLEVARIYDEIGGLFRKLGRHREALEYCEKALDIFSKKGEDSKNAGIYNNIALVLGELGKYQKALSYFEKALEINILQNNQLDAATTYHNIGMQLANLEKYTEALTQQEKALSIYETDLKEKDSLNIARIYNSMGSILGELGNYTKALEFKEKALKIRKEKLGEEEPETGATYNNVGAELQNLERYPEALTHFQKALEIYTKAFGEQHQRIGEISNNIGMLYVKLSDHSKALEFLQKSLCIHLQVFGESHPNTGLSYHNIGLVWEELKNYEEALKFFQKALTIHVQVLGENHPRTASSYNSVGLTLREVGQKEEALRFLIKAWEISLKTLRKPHRQIEEYFSNAGITLFELLGKY